MKPAMNINAAAARILPKNPRGSIRVKFTEIMKGLNIK
jgi:hypothetical protein